MLQEHRRSHGRSLESTPYDIYRYSVLFCWRKHSDTSLFVSFVHVELCRHSCKTEDKFQLPLLYVF